MNTTATDLQDAVVELKRSVRSAVDTALTAFRQQTGVSPSDIQIVLLDVSTVSDHIAHFAVGDVRLEFRL